jgi:aminoglycoside 6'-N-acetyltransferase I
MIDATTRSQRVKKWRKPPVCATRAGQLSENNLTSLGGIDLYPNPLDYLARIEILRGHPYEFYRKQGFVNVCGMPDADGFGKSDIYLAERMVRR